jgi:TetR/AcrR family transcriptional regulator, transcriptional repressor for nem operon
MGRPPKIDDAEILDRATALFWRDGCDAVSIRDLESALDLRAPAIYRRYRTKDQLIERCVERYVDRVVGGRIRRHLERSDDPLDGLRSFFSSALEPHPGERTSRGCLLTVTSSQTAFQEPAVRDAVRAGMDRIRRGFETQIARGQRTGQIRTDIGADAQAAHLLLVFEGLLVLARAGAPDPMAGVDLSLESLRR